VQVRGGTVATTDGPFVETALRRGRVGPHQVQAAIAALHVTAPTFAETDWAQIVLLSRALMRLAPTPVVALNAAVASGMAIAPEHGLRALAALAGDARSAGVLTEYHPWHASNDALPPRARRVAECERGLR